LKETNTAILGFGNPVRKDDAIGCYVLEKLYDKLNKEEHISLFDMGTSAFEVLFKLKDHQRIIIVDAVINSGEEDGTVFKLPASEINASIQDDPMVFLHSLKWDQALSYAKKIMGDEFPENDISVYLIAVTDTSLNEGISDPVLEAGEKVIDLIFEESKS